MPAMEERGDNHEKCYLDYCKTRGPNPLSHCRKGRVEVFGYPRGIKLLRFISQLEHLDKTVVMCMPNMLCVGRSKTSISYIYVNRIVIKLVNSRTFYLDLLLIFSGKLDHN